MGKKLPDDQMQLYRRLDEILYYVWDPIGISETPWPRDEYQAYLPQTFQMVMREEQKEKIIDYLIKIESEHMGLGKKIGIKKRVGKIVELMFELRDELINSTP